MVNYRLNSLSLERSNVIISWVKMVLYSDVFLDLLNFLYNTEKLIYETLYIDKAFQEL